MIIEYSLIQDQEIAADAAEDPCPDDNEAFRQLVKNIPSIYKPTVNPHNRGILVAIGQGDCIVRDTTQEVKDQLYVTSASASYLSRLGASVGVERPEFGMRDEDYRKLIPVMSYVPKQVRGIVQDLLQIWYGDEAVFANAVSELPEPFVLVNGQTLTLTIEGVDYVFVVDEQDFSDLSLATAEEIAVAFNKQILDAFACIQQDPFTHLKHIRIQSNVIGPSGSIEMTGGTASSTFDFPTGKRTLSSLTNPAVVYEVKTNEVVVVMPSTPSVVKRNETGAFYLNEDEDGEVESGYIFDPNAKFSVSGIATTTNEAVAIGTIQQALLATMPDEWPATGYLVFDYGLNTEEGPIRFIDKPNAGGLLLDPSYVFKQSHDSGATINYIRSLGAPTVPSTSPAAYVTGIAQARNALKDLIRRAVASGVAIRFEVLTPDYEFSNPSLDTNEAI